MCIDVSENDVMFPNGKDTELGIQYKTNIGRILNLSYPLTEVENYLESIESGDVVTSISRDNCSTIKDNGEYGLEIAHIYTLSGKEFTVFYNQKHCQFGLFLKLKINQTDYDYHLVSSWAISIEECQWFDPSVAVASQEY